MSDRTRILVVAATARELALPNGWLTLQCGVGPVEAVAHTAAAIAALRPAAVLHVGIAGALRALPDAVTLSIGTSACVGGTSTCHVEAIKGFGVLRTAQLAGVPAIEARAIW